MLYHNTGNILINYIEIMKVRICIVFIGILISQYGCRNINISDKTAYFITAEGNGTLSCTESGKNFEDRHIVFKPENSININGIYIKDHAGSPSVKVNGTIQKWTREGPDWKKRIKINWKGEADANGLTIEVK
jgi:hypothetical protein